MKASTFIKVALIDQMQQIADLGLWFHLATLLAKGLNTMAALTFPGENPETKGLYMMGSTYKAVPSVGLYWKSLADGIAGEHIWLSHEPEDAEKHCTYEDDGAFHIHVPTFFEHYKVLANGLLASIEKGNIEDVQMISK